MKSVLLAAMSSSDLSRQLPAQSSAVTPARYPDDEIAAPRRELDQSFG
ncbi:hypothetical protein [Corynebacterium sp. CCM 9203]